MRPAESDRQWIFPSLQFTCTVNLTGWIFITNTSDDVVCPLWNNYNATDNFTLKSLTPDKFTSPKNVDPPTVYRCTLSTPIVVDAGTAVGFLTRSPGGTEPKSSVMLVQSGDLVGYSRGIRSPIQFNIIAAAQTYIALSC